VSVAVLTARTTRVCAGATCTAGVRPGDRYQRHVIYPGEQHNEVGDRPLVYATCPACADRPLAWIRDRYGVPAVLDGPAVHDSQPGTIVGADDGHLLIRLADGGTAACHPMWASP
jgi:hypothetical protein